MKPLVVSLQHHEHAAVSTIFSIFLKFITSPPIIHNLHITGQRNVALEVERLHPRENLKDVTNIGHYGVSVPLHGAEVEWPGMPTDSHPQTA